MKKDKQNKIPDLATISDPVEKQKLSGYGRWKNEDKAKPTYNIYSDAHIKQNKSKAKRQELWQKLNDEEEKERKEKIALTKDFLPSRGSNVLIEELRSEESDNRIKIASTFFELPISDRTKEGLHQAGYSQMTVIQRASIPHSIGGRDVLGAAKTGSGKTLAFVIPLLELLWRDKVTQEAGLSAIILTPTRELAVQIFETLRLVGKFHETISAGLLIGGPKNYKEETQAVGMMNILIATPGRLLQHFSETAIDTNAFKMLIFDEADRMMDMGFKKEIDSIIEYLPPDRQTLLFSATQSASVTNLSRLSLNEPEYVAAHARAQQATPSTLQQYYTVVELHQKTNTLWSFLKSHLKDKIIIFFASQKEVAYYHDSFKDMVVGMRLLQLHGHMSQGVRTKIYYDFNEHVSGGGVCLFTTDVASRGLDFEKVSWIIQFDCPEDTTAYIHRVGRTARKELSGNALLLLLPSEQAIIADIEAKKIPLKCIELNPAKQADVQLVLQNACVKDPLRKLQAQKCFRSYVRSIDIGDHKYFKRNELPLEKYAQSIGLYTVPNLAEKYEKFDKNEARMLDHMKDLLKAQEEAEMNGEEIPFVVKKKQKTQSDLLLKRKNTDVFSKSAQSLVNVEQETDDDLFTRKTENKFHEIMEVDKLELNPNKRSNLTLDDLDLPLDDKGDDYYDQVEEELQGQDDIDRKAALSLIAEKKRQQKQRKHNYETYVLPKKKIEAEEREQKEEIDSMRKNTNKTPNQKFSGVQKQKKKYH